MLRTFFTRELQKLQDDLLLLGSMVRQALLEAVDALRTRDQDAARRIIAGDREINRRRHAIEDACLSLIATQQPMAGDLRLLAAILEISTELERMGDYAKGIGRINLMMGPEAPVMPLVEIPQMGEKAVDMLGRALDAFLVREPGGLPPSPARVAAAQADAERTDDDRAIEQDRMGLDRIEQLIVRQARVP